MFIALIIAVVGSTIISWIRSKEKKRILDEELKTGSKHRAANDGEEVLDEQLSKEVTKFEIVSECFSAQKTMQKLFSPLKYAEEDQEFEIVNSIKVFSIAMIVLGNTFYFIFNGPVRNLEET